jgi:subtilisin
VIDGGIDVDHPDLNVVGGKDCAPGDGYDDRHGHGTMVTGLIAALDDAIGRVGVAPGARLWAVRTANPDGFTTYSDLICGLGFVTSTRTDRDPSNDIAVVNMSLGGAGTKDASGCDATKNPVYLAVCRTVEAGVVPVASAGNEHKALTGVQPATFPEVLTVTAMADSDGQPGGLGGPPPCLPTESDDQVATFSSFAVLPEDSAHTLAAPGVCTASTYIDGLYARSSGTSFSAPLAAGTIALCLTTTCKGMSPRQVIEKMVTDSRAYNLAHPNYGFQGDPLRPFPNKYYGYLIHAGLY